MISISHRDDVAEPSLAGTNPKVEFVLSLKTRSVTARDSHATATESVGTSASQSLSSEV